MRPKAERGRRVAAWLGVACLGLLPSPLSAQEPKLRDTPSVAFSPDGKTLASGSGGPGWGAIKLWDLATSKERATLQGYKERVFSVAFSPDGKTLASGSYDETINLWDLARGKER